MLNLNWRYGECCNSGLCSAVTFFCRSSKKVRTRKAIKTVHGTSITSDSWSFGSTERGLRVSEMSTVWWLKSRFSIHSTNQITTIVGQFKSIRLICKYSKLPDRIKNDIFIRPSMENSWLCSRDIHLINLRLSSSDTVQCDLLRITSEEWNRDHFGCFSMHYPYRGFVIRDGVFGREYSRFNVINVCMVNTD